MLDIFQRETSGASTEKLEQILLKANFTRAHSTVTGYENNT